MAASKEPEARPSKSRKKNGSDPISSSLEARADPVTGEQTPADDTAAEMRPSGKSRSNTIRREADLSSLLAPGEKAEVTALVSAVTESMFQHITQLFDPAHNEPDAQTSRVSYWSKLPQHLKDLNLNDHVSGSQTRTNQWENVKPARSKKAGRARDKRDAARREADAPSQQDTEAAPRLQELKKEALLHFKKWQTAVHRRVGEISVKKSLDYSTAPGSLGQKRRPSSNRRGKPGGRAQYDGSAFQPGGGMSGPVTPSMSAIAIAADPLLTQLYPPLSTTLSTWAPEKRCLLLHALVLLLLSIENYGAYTRVLLLNIASALRLPLHVLADDEDRVGGALAQIAKDIPPELLAPRKPEDGKPPRRWKGLAGMAGAAAAGGTGKFMAVLEAARIGSVFGIRGIPGAAAAGLLGLLSENCLAAGTLFGICSVRPPTKTLEHYLKDVGDFGFLPLRGSIDQQVELGKVVPESRRLRVTLGVNGWLVNKDDATSPWQCLGQQSEVYAVRWELDALSKLSASFNTLVRSAAWSMAKKEIVARTIFSNLADGRWPAGLLKISKIIDNNWNNGMVRADKLGAAIADVIISRAQGERAVSLIGYSLGARAIYACLMCLAEKRAFGLVESAVLIGTPAPSEPLAWCAMKSVVSGRLVNVYSENDYILGFLYRTSSVEFGLAGLQRVTGVSGIENVDVTAKVSVHLRYQYLVGSILRHIGWEDTDKEQIARDEAEMSFYEDRNRKHEERRNAIELGRPELVKKENEQGIIRTRMRKKAKK